MELLTSLICRQHLKWSDACLRGVHREQGRLTLSDTLRINARSVAMDALRINFISNMHAKRAS